LSYDDYFEKYTNAQYRPSCGGNWFIEVNWIRWVLGWSHEDLAGHFDNGHYASRWRKPLTKQTLINWCKEGRVPLRLFPLRDQVKGLRIICEMLIDYRTRKMEEDDYLETMVEKWKGICQNINRRAAKSLNCPIKNQRKD
jgi:hypothetical protein